jgi:hypothetical protein
MPDWGEVWRGQPAGGPVDLRRRTRSEIWGSIAAAALLAGVVALRMGSRTPMAGVAAAALWIVVTVVWFRDRLRRERVDDVAAPAAEHYRRELERRRDHLRNVWVWHGPLIAACVMLAGVMGRERMLAAKQLWTVAPLVVALAVWVAAGVVARWREARRIDEELDELVGE